MPGLKACVAGIKARKAALAYAMDPLTLELPDKDTGNRIQVLEEQHCSLVPTTQVLGLHVLCLCQARSLSQAARGLQSSRTGLYTRL